MASPLNTYQRRLSYRMEQMGMTIQDLAAAIGVSGSAVHAWQKPGAKRIPKIANRRAIAHALHVDPEWLTHNYGPVPIGPGDQEAVDEVFDTTDAPGQPDAQATAKTRASDVLSKIVELRLAIALATCANVEDIDVHYSVRNRAPAFGGAA